MRQEVEDISKRDYVYYLAIAHTRLKVKLSAIETFSERLIPLLQKKNFKFQEYDRALAYVDVLLSAESSNRQALDLRDVIKHRMKKGM